jgi:hypothetical protein
MFHNFSISPLRATAVPWIVFHSIFPQFVKPDSIAKRALSIFYQAVQLA